LTNGIAGWDSAFTHFTFINLTFINFTFINVVLINPHSSIPITNLQSVDQQSAIGIPPIGNRQPALGNDEDSYYPR
jgi:hypothetical protein